MPKNQKLIIFFVPPEKLVNGGILSIFSIAHESRAYKNIHGAEVVLSTYPGTKSYKKNDLFKNDEVIFSFDELVERGSPEFLQLHVPEYASYNVFMSLKKYADYIGAVTDLRINIMNQNILLMQPPVEVAQWFSLTPHVTQTTAHNKYTSQAVADQYDLPTKHFSTFVDERQYHHVPYDKKDKVIALSPDLTKDRDSIVKTLEQEFPDYKVITIKNLTYEEYKRFISKAKFTITFGEGFDGYYVEAFFSGGVTLAVYNEEFFPDKDFSSYQNTFSSYAAMSLNLVKTIKQLDNKAAYQKVVDQNLAKINELYNFATYQENIKQFYLGNFSYLPKPPSAERLLGTVINEKDQLMAQKDALLAERDQTIKDMAAMIEQKEAAYQDRSKLVDALENSVSWKVTKPLRKASSIIRKK